MHKKQELKNKLKNKQILNHCFFLFQRNILNCKSLQFFRADD